MRAFFVIIFLIYTVANVYIFRKTWRVLPKTRIVRILFAACYIFLYSAFIIAMLGRNLLPIGVQKFLYFPGVCWLGAMLYLFLFFVITDLIYGIVRLFRNSENFRKIQALSGYILVAGLIIYGYYNLTHPKVSEQEIVIHKKAGKTKNLKIVGLSDLHLGVIIDKNRLKSYVQLVNAQNPDLVIIAGDMVDNNALPLMKEKMWEEFAQIQAPLGVYACLGNHEYLSGIQASLNFLRKTNIRLLIDSAALIDNSFWLIGRDDFRGMRNHRRKSLSDLVAKTNPNQPLFLLDHEPIHLNDAKQNGIDLQFSGHTHLGQILPISWIVKKVYETAYGYVRKGDTQYYITSGLGLWGPPLRIGTNSEIVFLNIRFD